MSELTYKRHTLEQSDVVPWPDSELPIWIDKQVEFRKNGFDPETDRARVFSQSWRGHPQFALVIAHSFDFPVGEEFVVSNESVYSVDPGKQTS